MKKIYSLFVVLFVASGLLAQTTICNPTANLIIFSNYDGGTLNINLDAPMSDIKIGVVSYEGVNINISGIGAGAVTAVAYAGFNANNAHCGSIISTNITGTPGSSVNTITFAPAAGLANPNGNASIICATTCSTTTPQGGCNTIDQIEDYFLGLFPGSNIFMHKVQYGCWSGTQNVSTGGTCCSVATGLTNLSFETPLNKATIKIVNVSGKLIKEENNLNGSNLDLDITGFNSGVYFIETTNGGFISHTKFIKE